MMQLRNLINLYILFIATLPVSTLAAEPLQFSSGDQQVQLVELYTSQGCSSCPPAEKWLNKFKSDDRLWKQVVPMAFHVDYWDYLGWRDSYASNAYSARQRQYRQQGNVRSVYTPGFVLNGKEWKGWFSRDPLPSDVIEHSVLSASLQNGQLTASYANSPSPGELVLNIAVLGFDIESAIAGGENAGRKLRHEFTVLAHDKHSSNSGGWQVSLPNVKSDAARRFGLALWVSPVNKLQPLQATGGWLPKEYLKKL